MNPYSQQHIASNLHTAHTCIKTALACVEAAYSTVRDERKLCERLELSGITSAITEFEINIRRALLSSPDIPAIFPCTPGRANRPGEPLSSPCSSGGTPSVLVRVSPCPSLPQEDHT